MAQSLIDPGLQDVKSAVGTDAIIFGELLGWGARLAIGECTPWDLTELLLIVTSTYGMRRDLQ